MTIKTRNLENITPDEAELATRMLVDLSKEQTAESISETVEKSELISLTQVLGDVFNKPVVFIGDSKTAGSSGFSRIFGYMMGAGNIIKTDVGYNQGVGGNTIQQVLDRIETVGESMSAIADIDIGTNDVTLETETAQTFIEKLEMLISLCFSYGAEKCIVHTITLDDNNALDTPLTPAQLQLRVDINDEIKALNIENLIVESEASENFDPSDFTDGRHFTVEGAIRKGKLQAKAISKTTQNTYDNGYLADNLITNPFLTGTGGTLVGNGNPTGTIADDWTGFAPNINNVAFLSTDGGIEGGYNSITMAVPSQTLDDDGIIGIRQTVNIDETSGGEEFAVLIRYKIEAGHRGIQNIEAQFSTYESQEEARTPVSIVTTEEISGYNVAIAKAAIPAGLTSSNIQFNIRFEAGDVEAIIHFDKPVLVRAENIYNSITAIQAKDIEQDVRINELGPSITQFGGGNGVQSEDTAAVQAIIDQGHTSCYLPDNDNYYEILGVTIPQGRVFKFIGQSQSAVIAARGTVAVYGDINANTNIFTFCENLGIRVFSDCINGIFSLSFCRNAKISKVHVVDDTNHAAIGTLCKLDRSYQFEFDSVTGSVKGFSIYELGDSTGLEVLDTVKINSNCVWHSNYVMFTRSGALNIHNLISSGKYRDVSGSDENNASNAGEARLTAELSVGDDTLVVDDASTLNSGTLAVNDLIYVGHGHNAEQVRVLSIDGNSITLDTALRFTKDADDPVIFGCVFHTMQSVLSPIVPYTHCEKAYVGFHLTNCDGFSISSAYTTCFELIRLVNDCRNANIGPVTYGSVGWSSPSLIGVPSYHDELSQHRNVNLNSAPSGSASVGFGVIRNDSAQSESQFLVYSGGAKSRFERSFNTVINAELISHAVIDVSGILNLSVLDGLFEGHTLRIDFLQTATGNRNITGYSDNINLSWPMYLSSKPFGRDHLELIWSGGEWIDTHRVLDDLQVPPRLLNLNVATNDSNTRNKFKWKPVERVTGDIVYASGSAPEDPYINANGDIIVEPQ